MAEVKQLTVRLEIIQQVLVVQVGVVRKVPLDVAVLEILLLKLLLKEMMVEPEQLVRQVNLAVAVVELELQVEMRVLHVKQVELVELEEI